MKTGITTVAGLMAGFCSVTAFAQQGYDPVPVSPEHAVFKNEIGNWDANITMWLPGQDEPATSSGSETCRMLGTFWLVSDMDYTAFGQSFSGHGIFGFDSSQGKYVGSWHGSESPWGSELVGTYDKSKKQMTWQMNGRDQSGEPMRGKLVTTYTDALNKKFEMYIDIGEESLFKMMQIEYSRKRKPSN